MQLHATFCAGLLRMLPIAGMKLPDYVATRLDCDENKSVLVLIVTTHYPLAIS